MTCDCGTMIRAETVLVLRIKEKAHYKTCKNRQVATLPPLGGQGSLF
jgi:hypothetical protein